MCDTPIVSVSGFSPEIHDTKNEKAESDMFRLHTPKEDKRMVDKEMLSAISDLLEEKLEGMEERLEQKLEEKLEQKLEQKLDEKLDQKLDEKLDQKLDCKLQPIYDRLDRLESDMKYVRVVQLENNVIPRLNTIEACYVDTAKRYVERTEQIDAMSADIKVLQSVVLDHSQKLSQISV